MVRAGLEPAGALSGPRSERGAYANSATGPRCSRWDLHPQVTFRSQALNLVPMLDSAT
jgi:hypothetical protein